jgi:hypothetical protein
LGAVVRFQPIAKCPQLIGKQGTQMHVCTQSKSLYRSENFSSRLPMTGVLSIFAPSKQARFNTHTPIIRIQAHPHQREAVQASWQSIWQLGFRLRCTLNDTLLSPVAYVQRYSLVQELILNNAGIADLTCSCFLSFCGTKLLQAVWGFHSYTSISSLFLRFVLGCHPSYKVEMIAEQRTFKLFSRHWDQGTSTSTF